MQDRPAHRFTHCSAAALRMAARRISQFYDGYLASEGLKVSQYSVLSTAARRRERPPTVNELADDLAMDRSTLGHNLRPLERDGLVVLAPDEKDKRIRRVVVTERGMEKRRACHALWALAQGRFEAAYGAERAAELGAHLSFIARSLELQGPTPASSDESASDVR
jgi:DNA-binding MarR family transcriptional regulator